MFDEMEFKKAYKEAYDRVAPDDGCLRRLMEERGRRERHSAFKAVVKPAAAAFAALCLLTVATLPVMAEKIPAVYAVVEKYAPALADYVLPVKMSSTSQGIRMQVEAINVEDKTAEILVSFSDEDESADLIKGRVDLYDSYSLDSYDSVSDVGGCSFLEYDEAEGKAYFKIDVATFDRFDRTKLRFSVRQILTNYVSETRRISLGGTVKEPAMKEVLLSGGGGMPDTELYEKYFGTEDDGSGRKTVRVLDLEKVDASMAETLTVTGLGYEDGILRVQICQGNFADADRHALFFIKDENGEERFPDLSVSWQEETEAGTLLLNEVWFCVEESMLEEQELYGEFYIVDGSVKGDWNVTFRIK